MLQWDSLLITKKDGRSFTGRLKNDCFVGRRADELTILFDTDFGKGKRNTITLIRNDWDFERNVRPVRVELVGRGSVVMAGIHKGRLFILVFPEKNSEDEQHLIGALGRTS